MHNSGQGGPLVERQALRDILRTAVRDSLRATPRDRRLQLKPRAASEAILHSNPPPSPSPSASNPSTHIPTRTAAATPAALAASAATATFESTAVLSCLPSCSPPPEPSGAATPGTALPPGAEQPGRQGITALTNVPTQANSAAANAPPPLIETIGHANEVELTERCTFERPPVRAPGSTADAADSSTAGAGGGSFGKLEVAAVLAAATVEGPPLPAGKTAAATAKSQAFARGGADPNVAPSGPTDPDPHEVMCSNPCPTDPSAPDIMHPPAAFVAVSGAMDALDSSHVLASGSAAIYQSRLHGSSFEGHVAGSAVVNTGVDTQPVNSNAGGDSGSGVAMSDTPFTLRFQVTQKILQTHRLALHRSELQKQGVQSPDDLGPVRRKGDKTPPVLVLHVGHQKVGFIIFVAPVKRPPPSNTQLGEAQGENLLHGDYRITIWLQKECLSNAGVLVDDELLFERLPDGKFRLTALWPDKRPKPLPAAATAGTVAATAACTQAPGGPAHRDTQPSLLESGTAPTKVGSSSGAVVPGLILRPEAAPSERSSHVTAGEVSATLSDVTEQRRGARELDFRASRSDGGYGNVACSLLRKQGEEEGGDGNAEVSASDDRCDGASFMEDAEAEIVEAAVATGKEIKLPKKSPAKASGGAKGLSSSGVETSGNKKRLNTETAAAAAMVPEEPMGPGALQKKRPPLVLRAQNPQQCRIVTPQVWTRMKLYLHRPFLEPGGVFYGLESGLLLLVEKHSGQSWKVKLSVSKGQASYINGFKKVLQDVGLSQDDMESCTFEVEFEPLHNPVALTVTAVEAESTPLAVGKLSRKFFIKVRKILQTSDPGASAQAQHVPCGARPAVSPTPSGHVPIAAAAIPAEYVDPVRATAERLTLARLRNQWSPQPLLEAAWTAAVDLHHSHQSEGISGVEAAQEAAELTLCGVVFPAGPVAAQVRSAAASWQAYRRRYHLLHGGSGDGSSVLDDEWEIPGLDVCGRQLQNWPRKRWHELFTMTASDSQGDESKPSTASTMAPAALRATLRVDALLQGLRCLVAEAHIRSEEQRRACCKEAAGGGGGSGDGVLLPASPLQLGSLRPCRDELRGGLGVCTDAPIAAGAPIGVLPGHVLEGRRQGLWDDDKLGDEIDIDNGDVCGGVYDACDAAVFSREGYKQIVDEALKEELRRRGDGDPDNVWQYLVMSYQFPYPEELSEVATRWRGSPSGSCWDNEGGATTPSTGQQTQVPPLQHHQQSQQSIPHVLCMLGHSGVLSLLNDATPISLEHLQAKQQSQPQQGSAASGGQLPNCAVVPVAYHGVVLPVVVALRLLSAGEQLFLRYGSGWWQELGVVWETAVDFGLNPAQMLHDPDEIQAVALLGDLPAHPERQPLPSAATSVKPEVEVDAASVIGPVFNTAYQQPPDAEITAEVVEAPAEVSELLQPPSGQQQQQQQSTQVTASSREQEQSRDADRYRTSKASHRDRVEDMADRKRSRHHYKSHSRDDQDRDRGLDKDRHPEKYRWETRGRDREKDHARFGASSAPLRGLDRCQSPDRGKDLYRKRPHDDSDRHRSGNDDRDGDRDPSYFRKRHSRTCSLSRERYLTSGRDVEERNMWERERDSREWGSADRDSWEWDYDREGDRERFEKRGQKRNQERKRESKDHDSRERERARARDRCDDAMWVGAERNGKGEKRGCKERGPELRRQGGGELQGSNGERREAPIPVVMSGPSTAVAKEEEESADGMPRSGPGSSCKAAPAAAAPPYVCGDAKDASGSGSGPRGEAGGNLPSWQPDEPTAQPTAAARRGASASDPPRPLRPQSCGPPSVMEPPPPPSLPSSRAPEVASKTKTMDGRKPYIPFGDPIHRKLPGEVLTSVQLGCGEQLMQLILEVAKRELPLGPRGPIMETRLGAPKNGGASACEMRGGKGDIKSALGIGAAGRHRAATELQKDLHEWWRGVRRKRVREELAKRGAGAFAGRCLLAESWVGAPPEGPPGPR